MLAPGTRLFLLTLCAAFLLRGQPHEIFLLIGQSNMAGRGVVEEQDRQPIPHVFMLNKAIASSYRQRFSAMIAQLRADLGEPGVPVVVGQLGEFLSEGVKPRSPFASVVDEQLAMVPLTVPHSAFVSSNGLTSNPDHLHFDARSQREFGRRYALAFLSVDGSWAR